MRDPLAHDSRTAAGEKPTTREGLLARYLAPSKYAKRCVLPDRIGKRFHSQLFRNIVFACEMAGELPWHVVNLVSDTQLGHADEIRYSFAPPTADVCCYLDPDHQNLPSAFSFRRSARKKSRGRHRL